MDPVRRGWRDVARLRHGYDLHLVASLGIGFSWIFQDKSRTQTAAWKVINDLLAWSPIEPFRVLGGLLVALGVLGFVGTYRHAQLGVYTGAAQTVYWVLLTTSIWWAALTNNAGFSAVFFPMVFAVSAAQYAQAQVRDINAHRGSSLTVTRVEEEIWDGSSP
jgi:hypothetical protein